MNDKELNELRCYANEIIAQLHKAKAIGQLEILFHYTLLSLKDLDPEWFSRFLAKHNETQSS